MKAYPGFLMALALTTTAASAPVSPALSSPMLISPVPGAPPYVGEAAKRFPQPARVGDLIGRQVLQPIEGQHVLGRVAGFLRAPDGSITMRVRFGGVLGFNTRLIDVPIGATAIMGEYTAILDLTPKQLAALPSAKTEGANAEGAVPLPPETMIHVPIVGPFH